MDNKVLKRAFTPVLFIAIFSVILSAGSRPKYVDNVKDGEATFSQWLRVEAGDGENQVGYRQDRISSGGPEDFLFTPGGELCIMDSVNWRIMFFKSGVWVRNLAIDFVNNPKLFCYYDGFFYILDEISDRIFKVNAETGEYISIAMPAGRSSIYVHDVFADENGAYVQFNDHSVYAVKGAKLVFNPMKRSLSFSGSQVLVDVGDRSWRIDTSNSGASIIHVDSMGNLYLQVYESTDDYITLFVEMTLRKYDRNGRLVGRAILPFDDWFCSTSRLYRFDGDERIHILICEDGFVSVQTLTLGTSTQTNMPEYIRRAREIDEERYNR